MTDWANIVKVVSATKTLEYLPLGKPKGIKHKDITENVIRSTVTRLSKKGYSFYVKPTFYGTEVTRIK